MIYIFFSDSSTLEEKFNKSEADTVVLNQELNEMSSKLSKAEYLCSLLQSENDRFEGSYSVSLIMSFGLLKLWVVNKSLLFYFSPLGFLYYCYFLSINYQFDC